MSKFKRPEKGDKPVEVGSWLLPGAEENQPQGNPIDKDDTVYIHIDKIKPNAKNDFSKEEIEKLAEMIKLGKGIWQNLIVKPEDNEGFYTITTGERRWRAACLLRDRGEYPEKLEEMVPCTIKDPNELELPLSEESKEMFSILLTNQYRDKTDGDRMMEYREWKKIFAELRKQGVIILYNDGTYLTEQGLEAKRDEDLQGIQTDNKSGMQISGVKTRELVAGALGVSTGQVSRMETVEKKASGSVMNSLLSDNINLSEAEKLASLPKHIQEKLIDEKKDKNGMSSEKLEKAKKKYVAKIVLNRELFEKDITELIELFTTEQIELAETDYKKYKQCLAQMRKMLEV